MKNKVYQYIQTNNLFPKNAKIIVAVSGGVDSVCLLHILKNLNYEVVLAHVNHHKRQSSDIEQNAMENLAKTMNIPYEIHHYYDDNIGNFHDKSHNARYSFFKQIADKYNTKFIATAHHLDDQAETILIKLLNGSNLYGYGGISNLLIDEDYYITRPLLFLTKDDLYNYANTNNLQYFEDESNKKDDYLRNRIRHNIIPILKNEEPAILEKFQEFSIQAKEAFQFIRNQSINYLAKTNNIIELTSFNELDNTLKKDILCLLFERYPIRKNNDIINQCFTLVLNPKGNKTISLKNNYVFVLEYDKAYICKTFENIEEKHILTLENEICFLQKYKFYFSHKITQKNNAKYIKLCYNDLRLPLTIRTKKNGDHINMSYGNKKVSKLMIDNKLTQQQRQQTPLIFDCDNNLLWVYPIAKSNEVIDQKSKGDIFLVCEEIENEK